MITNTETNTNETATGTADIPAGAIGETATLPTFNPNLTLNLNPPAGPAESQISNLKSEIPNPAMISIPQSILDFCNRLYPPHLGSAYDAARAHLIAKRLIIEGFPPLPCDIATFIATPAFAQLKQSPAPIPPSHKNENEKITPPTATSATNVDSQPSAQISDPLQSAPDPLQFAPKPLQKPNHPLHNRNNPLQKPCHPQPTLVRMQEWICGSARSLACPRIIRTGPGFAKFFKSIQIVAGSGLRLSTHEPAIEPITIDKPNHRHFNSSWTGNGRNFYAHGTFFSFGNHGGCLDSDLHRRG